MTLNGFKMVCLSVLIGMIYSGELFKGEEV